MKQTYFLMMVLLLASPMTSWGGDSQADHPSPSAVARLKWNRIKGRVSAIHSDKKSLEICDLDGNLTDVAVDNNVMILKSYRVVDFEALKPKDRVELRYVRAD